MAVKEFNQSAFDIEALAGKGIGGGGGSPGGGGGGGGGGRPGEESVGNNLSFPAIFPDGSAAPVLRGTEGLFTFTTPASPTVPVDPGYVYFAQGLLNNVWQAENIALTDASTITVDYVDIGDALESAPLKQGSNVRLELTLYQDLTSTDSGEAIYDYPLTGFAMTLLGGAKGGGKASTTGPTESQGARLASSEWTGSPYLGTTETAPAGTTFESNYASIYAAESTGGETTNSYMSLSVQKVTGLDPGAAVTGLAWNGSQWVDADAADAITVGANLSNTLFGPELNIAGKYIMGASGKPWKFTADGTYLITFALEDGAPVLMDANTVVANFDAASLGFLDVEAGSRPTEVIADGLMGAAGGDTHNGLLAMIVGVPSTVGGEGE
jgi:hypothetical protein